jgi:hypothetical protein
MILRSRLAALVAALALLSAGPGCRGRCAGWEPALQVTVRLDDAIPREAIKRLHVVAEVTPAGSTTTTQSTDYDNLTAELADGQTSFVIYPGESARGGFSATITVTAHSTAGRVAEGRLTGSFTGDACNFPPDLWLTRISIVDGGLDGPRDLGRDTAPDLAVDSRGDTVRPDGTVTCAPAPTPDSALCPKKPGWVNVWPTATDVTWKQCKGPDGNDYDLIGDRAAPFFNVEDCGTSKSYALTPPCNVLIVATGNCGSDCEPYSKISFLVDYSFDGKNWSVANPPSYDLACPKPDCKSYTHEVKLGAPGVAHLRIRAASGSSFRACVYQGGP